MASKYIVTQVEPIGGGTVTRTENIVDRTEHFDTYDYYNEFRYHWNCDTLQAIPAPGYVFDRWRISATEKWYDAIPTPSGQSPFLWENTWTPAGNPNNPIVITIKDGQVYPDPPFNSSPPGYIEGDTYVPIPGSQATLEPLYYRPWVENIWTFTAVFKKVGPEPTYTHLPVYSTTQNKLMYHMAANKLLRDSP